MIFSCRYSSKATCALVSEDAAFDFEKKDVRLLVPVLVCVFEKKLTGCERFARAVISPAGQQVDMIREGEMAHAFLLAGMLLIKGKGDVGTF